MYGNVVFDRPICFVYIRLLRGCTCRIEFLEEEEYTFAIRTEKLFSPLTLKKYQMPTAISQPLAKAEVQLFAGLSTGVQLCAV